MRNFKGNNLRTVLLAILVAAVFAPTVVYAKGYTLALLNPVGVKAGDWIKYGQITVTWTGNGTEPSSVTDAKKMGWLRIDVLSVAGTTASAREIEEYRGYDDRHNINDVISQEDIDAANNLYAMIDQYDKTESRRLLSRSERIRETLSKVPNRNINDLSQKEWIEVKNDVQALLEKFLLVSGIGLAKATKILHLKRPNLFPILDSFVIKLLLNADISDVEKGLQLGIGLQALERTREIMTEQEAAFTELANQTRDLPISLIPVRLFDILCWTAEKWDIRRNLTAPYGTPHKSLLATPKRGRLSGCMVPSIFFINLLAFFGHQKVN